MSDRSDNISLMRTALAHLHDPAFLENHPLAGRLDIVAKAPGLSRGELLRRAIQLSIEALNPGIQFSPTSREARAYRLLRGRYILGEAPEQVAAQLGIGRRQAERDVHDALAALAQILRDSCEGATPDSNGTNGQQSSPAARVRAEIGRLADLNREEVDVAELLADCVEKARLLASERGQEIVLQMQAAGLRVSLNRVMLRQALLNLLSHAVRMDRGGSCEVSLAQSGELAIIRLTYRRRNPSSPSSPAADDQPYAVAAQLLSTLGLAWDEEIAQAGLAHITVHVPLPRKHTILFVDDNRGLLRLFERYLEGQPYTVYSVTSVDEALEMLPKVRPEVVVLDVMIPKRDGWDLLEAIRRDAANSRTRLLVCSIIDDPHLATALGADGFIHKPVDQVSLLGALRDVLSSTA